MHLLTTLTGSYPPIYQTDNTQQTILVEQSIVRAVKDQIDVDIDILVDGQVQADIVALFAPHISGYDCSVRPYTVVGPIEPPGSSITADSLQFARQVAEGLKVKKPFKAHITGPTTLAWQSSVAPESPYDSYHDRKLILDLARALAAEARFLKQEVNAEIIQIDEPVFWRGVDLDVGLEAIAIISAEIDEPILHVCGDIRPIFKHLLKAPVKVLCVEGRFLDKIPEVSSKLLKSHNKKIGFGCVSVDSDTVENTRSLQDLIRGAIKRYGLENIWAITPECGLRKRSYKAALNKMHNMVEAARNVTTALKIDL